MHRLGREPVDPTPQLLARRLLDALDLEGCALPASDERSAATLWALSGAMSLTGYRDGNPLPCAAPLAACAQGAWLALAALCPGRLDTGFDAFRLLGERAAIAGLARAGRVSPGGACRLLDAADGTLALNLAREEDWQLLPAWLECELAAGDEQALDTAVRARPVDALVARARLLGLASAAVAPPRPCASWCRAERFSPAAPQRRGVPVVIDLSALWAGPLCAQLLAQAGARVIKVESIARPDGARGGPAAFYDLLNGGKESVALDLREARDRARLLALIRSADIVIESARPRGLEQLGIRAADVLASSPGLSWLGISGYGRRAPMRDWIAYGDDAGVAAGLSWLLGRDSGATVFCADAIGDPLAGLHAAVLAWAAWRSGGGVLLDVSLRRVLSWCIAAGNALPRAHEPALVAAEPRARPATRVAAALGADTARVLREFAA